MLTPISAFLQERLDVAGGQEEPFLGVVGGSGRLPFSPPLLPPESEGAPINFLLKSLLSTSKSSYRKVKSESSPSPTITATLSIPPLPFPAKTSTTCGFNFLSSVC